MINQILGPDNGSPTKPFYEQTLTAWAMTNKESLGLVKDTINTSFTQINPRYQPGYMGGFGYQSTPSRPLLDHPLETGMTSNEKESAFLSPESTAIYEELVNELPNELQNNLKSNLNLAPSIRNATYVILNQTLSFTAQGLAQATKTASAENSNATTNTQETVQTMATNTVAYGDEIGQSIQDLIDLNGVNSPDHDNLNHALISMNEGMDKLNAVVNELKTLLPNEQLSSSAKLLAASVADDFSKLSDSVKQNAITEKTGAIAESLSTLSVVSGALSLPYLESIPCYFALYTSSAGLSTSISCKGLSKLMKGTMPKANRHARRFARLLAGLGFSAAIAGAFEAISEDDDDDDDDEENINSDEELARSLAFSNMLHLIIHSKILDNFFKEIGNSCIDGKAPSSIPLIFSRLLTVLMTIAATEGNKRYSAARIIEQEADYLNEGIIAASELLDEFNRSGSADESVRTINITLALLQNSLEEKQYGSFIDIFMRLFESVGASSAALFKDFKQIKELSSLIKQTVTQYRLQYPTTEVVGIIT